MKSPLLFYIAFIIITSCSTKKEEKITLISEVPFHINVDSLLQINMDIVLNSNEFINKDWIRKAYEINNYKTIWIDKDVKLNKIGDSVLSVLQYANYFGLEPKDYGLEKLQNLKKELLELDPKKNSFEKAILFELLMSDSFMFFGKHLNYGKIHNIDSLSLLERKRFELDVPTTFVNTIKSENVSHYLSEVQPKQQEYRRLQKALQNYVRKSNLSKEKVAVFNFRDDSVKAYSQAKKALIIHQYILKKDSDSKLVGALKKFQIDHGLSADGVVGTNTAEALSISPFEYYQNAAISLERWRWKKAWESSYVHVNIPQFVLTYYENDSLQLMSRVVVGTRFNKTPEVYSKLSYLVAYPYWHVPRSISVSEIMVKAKNDSSYMRKNNFEVFSKALDSISLNDLDWATINENNFNYYIRQKGGSSNSLGFVKFIFQNDYSIYLHDTPTKYHFDRDIRNYSHGCIRVAKPMQLADTLLKSDSNEFNADSINNYVMKRKEKKMMFTRKLPIYIQYITCVGRDNNELIFYKDIYGYDDKIRKILFEKF